MKKQQQKGAILVAVIVVAVVFAIIGFSILSIAEHEAILGRIDTDKTRAFYLAEAGLAKLSETLQTPVVLDPGGTCGLLQWVFIVDFR